MKKVTIFLTITTLSFTSFAIGARNAERQTDLKINSMANSKASCQALQKVVKGKKLGSKGVKWYKKQGKKGLFKPFAKRWTRDQVANQSYADVQYPSGFKPSEWDEGFKTCSKAVNNEKFMDGVKSEDFANFMANAGQWRRYYPNLEWVKPARPLKNGETFTFKTFNSVQKKCQFVKKKRGQNSWLVSWDCSSYDGYGVIKAGTIQHKFEIVGLQSGGVRVYSQECQNGMGISLLGNEYGMNIGHGLQLDAAYCAQRHNIYMMDYKEEGSLEQPNETVPPNGNGVG